MRRGSEIEVSSNENGFKGAWFKAILEDAPSKYGNKKLTVRYVSLLAIDGSALRETTYRRFIRPVPPENLFPAVDFEEGSIVEAFHRDGWWICEVVKKIDEDKHLVYFDSPPDLIQFKRKQLRQHFDWGWTKREWILPQNKHLSSSSSKSMFRRGTMVEVKEETDDVVWVPSIIVKEMRDGKSFVVKSSKYLTWNDEMKPNRTVSFCSIRLPPPPLYVESYELLEPVEVFVDPGWRPGIVQKILRDKCYTITVCLNATTMSLEFKHLDLRPSKESISKRFKTREPTFAQESGNEITDGVLSEAGGSDITATPMMTFEPINGEKLPEENNNEDDSRKRKRGEREHNSELNGTVNEPVSPVTPSLAINATALIQTEAETLEKRVATKTVQPVRKQNSLGNDSTPDNEISEDNNRKRNREQNLSSASGVEGTQANDTRMGLPFAKKSTFWKMCETVEVFQRVPQNPHFSPLLEAEEDFREGFALGMMLTFSTLMEKLKDLETDVPVSQLDSLKYSFAKLERHGFDVTTPLARISKLLVLKDRQHNIIEELKSCEKEIMDESSKERKAEEELSEMKRKIFELQREQVALRQQKEAAYYKKCQIESSVRDLGVELEDVECKFERITSAPW